MSTRRASLFGSLMITGTFLLNVSVECARNTSTGASAPEAYPSQSSSKTEIPSFGVVNEVCRTTCEEFEENCVEMEEACYDYVKQSKRPKNGGRCIRHAEATVRSCARTELACKTFIRSCQPVDEDGLPMDSVLFPHVQHLNKNMQALA
eukprot:CAMPEP_0177760260 /NCGR_PEP_ID=MMETSP0491_2-20121128/5172_1 /TAXON_ID=63592 /ORGANISM="Tetraselmis chuii, Strain PLY429" /LENGTH=148 /DNA_ID=CAMNT_0019276147 /DNA_START=150 /DNA_END=596 /DNA_ORIENTATION=-